MTESELSTLQLYEEEFKDRYTENDEDFMKVKQADVKNPPIVDDNYEGRNQRHNRSHDRGRHNQNWQRYGQDRGRDNFRDRSNYYGGGYRQQEYRYY